MAGNGIISDVARRFLARYIDSVERIEVLHLLQRDPAKKWSAKTVASALGIRQSAADRQLAKLCAFNLLNVQIAHDLFYWYEPRPPALEREAAATLDDYQRHRLAVINLIAGSPEEPVRSFADAFRLTKKDDSDG